jgi:tetratricopeptide (TPR) repeat protein
MPDSIHHILKQCLNKKPERRCASMREIEGALIQAFEETQGRVYPRIASSTMDRRTASTIKTHTIDEKQKPSVAQLAWLRKARSEAGLRHEVAANIRLSGLSRKARPVALIVLLEDACEILEPLVESGRDDLRILVGGLYSEKGELHAQAGDDPGAIRLYDRAITFFEHLAGDEIADDGLTWTLQRKALSLLRLGNFESAKAVIARAIILQKKHSRSSVLTISLIETQEVVYMKMADIGRALKLQDLAISLGNRLVVRQGRSEFRFWLASSYSSKATALSVIGDRESAISFFDKAITHYEKAGDAHGHGRTQAHHRRSE